MSLNVDQVLLKAKRHLKKGDVAAAVQLYHSVLAKFPKNKRAIVGLEAIKSQRAFSGPKNQEPPKAQLQELTRLYNQGLYQQALEAAEKLAKQFPQSLETLAIIGAVSFEVKDFDRALNCYQLVAQRAPEFADTYFKMGIVFGHKGDLIAAMASFQKTLDINPDHAQAHNSIGIMQLKSGELDAAFASASNALRLVPDYAEAHKTIGDVCFERHDLKAAVDSYRRALELNPDAVPVHNNLAAACLAYGDRVGAIQSYDALLKVQPDHQEAWAKKLHQMAHLCDWSAFDPDFISSLGLNSPDITPFSLLTLEDAPERHLIRSKIHARSQYSFVPQPFAAKTETKSDRLRIGYFSADVHQHPVMVLLAKVLQMHDRNRFEIFFYGFSPKKSDPLRERIIAAVDVYDDVLQMRDIDIAHLARQDGIDIAIDLNGYTENSRSGIFAHRAAPVQISYLGYPGSMGADFIDYIVADKNLIPESSQVNYSEKPIYLPHHYQAQDNELPIDQAAPNRTELGLPENGFVFCALSNSYKITPAEFDLWMRLLQAVDGSVLWLLQGNTSVLKNLMFEAAKRGVDPARLVFATHTDHGQYLARFQRADLYLDTFIYNAGATASNALWAGLPVLTKRGHGYTARMAASLLNSIELPELITDSEQAYEALAIDLATNPVRMAAVKAKLVANRRTTPLFNTELFTRHLEEGYQQAYDRYSEGKAPDVIEVTTRV